MALNFLQEIPRQTFWVKSCNSIVNKGDRTAHASSSFLVSNFMLPGLIVHHERAARFYGARLLSSRDTAGILGAVLHETC